MSVAYNIHVVDIQSSLCGCYVWSVLLYYVYSVPGTAQSSYTVTAVWAIAVKSDTDSLQNCECQIFLCRILLKTSAQVLECCVLAYMFRAPKP